MAPQLDDDTFWDFSGLLQDSIGVRIRPGGRAEFEAHLLDRVAALRLRDCDQYLAVLRDGGSTEELHGLIEAVVPIESTPLLDDYHPVTALREWLASHAGPIHVWSAGCGDGRETRDFLALCADAAPDLDVYMVASDIHGRALEQAENATPDPRVTFARRNLLQPLEGFDQFDLVLLRSVLPDFDQPTRARVLAHVHRTLRPDGLLVLGEGESLLNVDHAFRLLQPSVFLRTIANTRSRS